MRVQALRPAGSGADVAEEQRVEGGGVEIRARTEPGEASVVDEHVDVSRIPGELIDLLWVGKVRCHESGVTACVFDRSDRLLRPVAAVASVHDDENPSFASATATARPMPDVAPVTRATRGAAAAAGAVMPVSRR